VWVKIGSVGYGLVPPYNYVGWDTTNYQCHVKGVLGHIRNCRSAAVVASYRHKVTNKSRTFPEPIQGTSHFIKKLCSWAPPGHAVDILARIKGSKEEREFPHCHLSVDACHCLEVIKLHR